MILLMPVSLTNQTVPGKYTAMPLAWDRLPKHTESLSQARHAPTV